MLLLGAFVTGSEVSDISYWWSIVASIANIVTILILVVIAKWNKSSYWK